MKASNGERERETLPGNASKNVVRIIQKEIEITSPPPLSFAHFLRDLTADGG